MLVLKWMKVDDEVGGKFVIIGRRTGLGPLMVLWERNEIMKIKTRNEKKLKKCF